MCDVEAAASSTQSPVCARPRGFLSWRDEGVTSRAQESLFDGTPCTFNGDLMADVTIEQVLPLHTSHGKGVSVSPVTTFAAEETPLKTTTSAVKTSYPAVMFSTPQSTTAYYGCSESAGGWTESDPTSELELHIFHRLLQRNHTERQDDPEQHSVSW